MHAVYSHDTLSKVLEMGGKSPMTRRPFSETDIVRPLPPAVHAAAKRELLRRHQSRRP